MKAFKKWHQRHKVAARSLLVLAVACLLIVVYSAAVVIKAYGATPRIVAQATAPAKLKLRLEDIPTDYQHILLTVEDPNFYTHRGVDFTTSGAGLTTITQADVKRCFYQDFTPGLFKHRKLEQSLIAWAFNNRVDKRTQLLIFVNAAYLGTQNHQPVVGFGAASRAYFHKDFAALSRDEFISLVAMLIAPNELSVSRQPTQNRERVKRIKRLLKGECKPAGYDDVYYAACA